MKRLATIAALIGVIVVAAGASAWAMHHHHSRSYPTPDVKIASATLQPPAAAKGLVAPDVTARGTSFVMHGAPVQLEGYDVQISEPSVYTQAARLNANFVRLVAPWSTIEPAKPTGAPGHMVHHWNAAALTALDREVKALGKQGVQVLIDFHQYHWSPYFAKLQCHGQVKVCHATGVPAWFYAGRYPVTATAAAAARTAFWTSDKQASLYYFSAFADMMAARYGKFANVVGYEIFNEPHAGHLPDTTGTTNIILAWENQIYTSMHAVDPARTMFIMCRGGGEGVGTADLGQFGKGAKIALDFHDYFNGTPGMGLDAAGDDWSPSWAATHNQDLSSAAGYSGTEAAQAKVLQVPITAARKAGIPLIVGEWGIHSDDPNATTYTSQMVSLFHRTGVSFARWELAPGAGFGLLAFRPPHPPNLQAVQMQVQLAR